MDPTALAPTLQPASAVERLRLLPRVFTQAHALKRLGWSQQTGRLMLSRWARRGWITALGPRAGVYLNGAAVQVTTEDRLLGLSAVTPSAVLIGASAYAFAGATTQIPRDLHVAVLRGSAHPALDGVRYYLRPIGWYHAVAPALLAGLVFRLRPEWAWVDAHAFADPWLPDLDELEFSEEDAEEQLRVAAVALGVHITT